MAENPLSNGDIIREKLKTGSTASEHSIPPRRRNGVRLCKKVVCLLLILLSFSGLLFFIPFGTAIQIGADEGFELAKAELVLNGTRSYRDFWNDQPPLHTFLTSECAEHFTPRTAAARAITVGFAVLLLISFFGLCLRTGGNMVATIAAALLISSPGFLELSASCMLEIPALAPALAGLAVLALPGKRSFLYKAAAALLFGLALSTKLIVLIFLPIAGFILFLKQIELAKVAASSEKVLGQGLKAASVQTALFVILAGVAFIVINFLVDRGAFLRHFHQSWTSHFASAKSFEYGSANDNPFDWSILLKNWDLTVPALCGIVIILRQWKRDLFLILPAAWLVFMLAVFSIHRPWWSYYYIHIAIPLCWCAGIGIVRVWGWVRQKRSAVAYGVFGTAAVCILAWNATRVYLQISDIQNSPQIYSNLVLQEIERFKPFTRFIYAEEPVYSFHAGIPLPPQLAVVPLKRLWSGDMTNARIAEEMRATKPELVMLKNSGIERPFSDLLLNEYQMVYEDEAHRLYAHRTIVNLAEY